VKGVFPSALTLLLLVPGCLLQIGKSIRYPGVPVELVSVHDGDSVTVRNQAGEILKLRLKGIDAPELKQPFGRASRDSLAAKLDGASLRAELGNKDKYRRILAVLYVGNEDINLWMVKQGWAWQYLSKREDMKEAELEARKDKLGLWEGDKPVLPWEWRKRQ